MRKNPRKICWTILYRRKHKKGQQEEEKKKKLTRRVVKVQRAIIGASLQDILKKRQQAPEVREQQRQQAIKAAKDKQRQKDAAKKANKARLSFINCLVLLFCLFLVEGIEECPSFPAKAPEDFQARTKGSSQCWWSTINMSYFLDSVDVKSR